MPCKHGASHACDECFTIRTESPGNRLMFRSSEQGRELLKLSADGRTIVLTNDDGSQLRLEYRDGTWGQGV